jgi:hypothetical protein
MIENRTGVGAEFRQRRVGATTANTAAASTAASTNVVFDLPTSGATAS